jgi:hypothetical protein
MKHGAVVPDVVGGLVKLGLADIRCDPPHPLRQVAEPALGYLQRGLADIEHGHVGHPAGQQIVHQSRSAAANVDYPRVGAW